MNAGKEFIKEAYRAIYQKDYQKAIELFKKAITRDSSNPTYYYKLSVTYARNNKLPEAIAAAEQAMRLRPKHSYYEQHLKMLQGRQLAKEALRKIEGESNLEEAKTLLELSIQMDPINSRSRILYAWLLKELGDIQQAIAELAELLAYDPWNREAKELMTSFNRLEEKKKDS